MSGQEWVPEPADLRGDDRPLSPAVGPELGAAPPHLFSPPTGPAYPPPHVIISPKPPEDPDDAADEGEYDDDAGDETNPTEGDEPAAPRRRFGFGFRLPRFRARRDDGTETEEGEVEVIAGPDGEPLPPDDEPADEQNDAPRRGFRFNLRLPRFGRGASAEQNEPNTDADADLYPSQETGDGIPEHEAAEGDAPSRRTGLLTALAIKREARVGLAAVVSFLILVAVWVNNKGRIVPLSVPPPGDHQKEGEGSGKDEKKPDGKKDGAKPNPESTKIDLVSKGGETGAKPAAKADDPSARFEAGATGGGTSPPPPPTPGAGAIVHGPNPAEPGLPAAAPMATPLEGAAPTAVASAEVPSAAPLDASNSRPTLEPSGTVATPAPPATAPETNVAELPSASPTTPMPEAPTQPPTTTPEPNPTPAPAASDPLPMPMPDPVPPPEPKTNEPPPEVKTPEVVPDLNTLPPATPAATPPPSGEPVAPPMPMPSPTPMPGSEPAMPTLPPSDAEPARPAEPMPSPSPAPAQETTPPPMQTPPFEPVPSSPETPAPTPAAAPAVSGDGWVSIRAGSRRSVVSTPGGVDIAAGAGAAAGAAGAVAADVIPDGPPPREDAAARNQAEIKLHRVARGENFWTISQRYYGEGRFYKALWAANAKEVPDIRELYVGDVVRIPPPAMLDPRQIDPPAKSRPRVVDRNLAPDVRQASNPDEEGASRGERTVPNLPPVRRKPARDVDVEPDPDEPPRRPSYIVRPNQTLRSIARDTLGDSRRADEILQLNRPLLRDAGDLAPGQRITLPADATVNGRRGR